MFLISYAFRQVFLQQYQSIMSEGAETTWYGTT
jgi:hypothetical protein